MVDYEDSFEMKTRNVQWSPSFFTVPMVRVRRWCAMGMPRARKQKDRCHVCGRRSRENPPQCLSRTRAVRRCCMPLKNASLLRGLTRTDRASHAPPCPVGSKKRRSASSLTYHSARPGSRGSHFHHAGSGRTDGSFVLKQAHDSWMWIALCRKSRQVVASAVGDRRKKTCQRLWEAIPEGYRQGHCFSDFSAAYAAVIPQEQHTAVGKERGLPPDLSSSL